MKIFSLSSLFLFFFFISFGCNWSSQNYAKPQNGGNFCIERIISSDNELGSNRNHDCETISLEETVLKYVAGMEKLDFKDCPKAFSDAFKAHIDAWKNMIPVLNRYPNIRGEMHDLFKQIEDGDHADIFKSALANVWDTWAQVENAMKQGNLEKYLDEMKKINYTYTGEFAIYERYPTKKFKW